MKKVTCDFSLKLDSPVFCQLHTLSVEVEQSLDVVVADLIDLALYCVQHGYYPFDEWHQEKLDLICNKYPDPDDLPFPDAYAD